MKKQNSTPEKLQLIKYTVAHLSTPYRTAGNKQIIIDDNTTASSLVCRTFMM